MILYYTGPNQPDQPSNASKSLGGYISNTVVINGVVSNLFPEVTRGAIRDQKKEIRCIALLNEGNTTIADVKIYTTTPEDSLFIYKMGVIAPALDPVCNKYYFGTILSPNQLPLTPSLAEHETIDDAIDVAEILGGKYIGIWISREFKDTTLAMFVDIEECSDESLANLVSIETLNNTQSNINIIITY